MLITNGAFFRSFRLNCERDESGAGLAWAARAPMPPRKLMPEIASRVRLILIPSQPNQTKSGHLQKFSSRRLPGQGTDRKGAQGLLRAVHSSTTASDGENTPTVATTRRPPRAGSTAFFLARARGLQVPNFFFDFYCTHRTLRRHRRVPTLKPDGMHIPILMQQNDSLPDRGGQELVRAFDRSNDVARLRSRDLVSDATVERHAR